ncbi:Paramyosin [Heracleum sosnowskyi]|uniref:Paramyosin n=1 Tax=Heracleum sosnowskyi TaxID=360622 RepID=A0AAD8NAY9_9APIA|nr:Paramyosin [Heracleum sosnowskyi]
MTSNADDSNDAVLSDVEDDDPVAIEVASTSQEDFSVEKFRQVIAELGREREAREALESSKSDLQVSFNRLKVLAHEAIRKRDETNRVKDEVLRERDEAVREIERLRIERDEVVREREKLKLEVEEFARVKDEITEKCDEAVRGKEAVRGEVETGARMLLNGIEKISGKVSGFRDFSVGGLPRSQKYSGLPAVAYGVIKRTNEIVEEMIRQVELIGKERNEVREQMEQRNYEIAIEVSQLEATIDGLKEEVGKKGSVVEDLEKVVEEKDGKLRGLEKEMLEKKGLADDELARLRELVDESEGKLKDLEVKMDSQRPLLVEQLKYVAKIHDQIDNVIKVVDGNKLDQSELSESLFLPKETDMEENIRASLAGMESIYELSRNVVEKTRELVEERSNEVKRLNDTVSQLVKEKEHIGTLLRSALSKRVSADLSSKTNELFKVAENGLKEAGIDYKFSNRMGDGKGPPSNDKESALVAEEDEIYTLAGALENIIKQSQLEIIELKHIVDELRAEANLLRQHVEAQAKELIQRKQKLEELEEKERVANDNVEGLMMDIAVAEEEITRWKVAAQQEADAGKAVEQDFMVQLSVVRQELEEAKQAVIESEKKLKFKEETADAAMAARDAAEKSLRLADLRSSRLRDKVEELTRQLETQETSRSVLSRPRYACWPWEWLGLNFVGSNQPLTQQESSNEMELSEPLI